MLLQDLIPGEKVSLAVTWGGSTYEIPTTVVAIQSEGILVSPFVYKGVLLDLGAHHYKDMRFSLNVIDKIKDSRFTWRSVNLEMTTYKNKPFYLVKTNNFAHLGSPSDRRDHKRMVLDIPGTAIIDKKKISVSVHDLSDNGVSFVVQSDEAIAGRNLKVAFRDMARGEEFDMTMDCECVRKIIMGNQELWGCKLRKASNDMLAYVFMKRSDLQREMEKVAL